LDCSKLKNDKVHCGNLDEYQKENKETFNFFFISRKRGQPLHWNKFEFPYTKMLPTKFD